jgi:hypothetical protein
VRRAAAVGLLVLLASCGSDDAPLIEAGDDEVTTSEPQSSTTTEYRDSVPSTSAATEVQTLELVLTGDTEVPGPGSAGTAEATLTYDGDELCVTGDTTDVGALIGGHVHAGLVGESGAIMIDLGIETDGDGPFEGCATVGAEGGVVLVDPTSYYLNLHTAEFPEGAVRAQLG